METNVMPISTNELFLIESESVQRVKNLRKLITLINKCQRRNQGLYINIPEELFHDMVREHAKNNELDMQFDNVIISNRPEASLGHIIKGMTKVIEYFSISDMVIDSAKLYSFKPISRLEIPLESIERVEIDSVKCWEGDDTWDAYISLKSGEEIIIHTLIGEIC